MFPGDTSADFEQRRRMVEDQLRRRGIRDERVLKVMEQLPRHLFIPQDKRDEAYFDQPVPIGWGQTISQPYIVALMTEKLEIQPHHQVLEIGTGSGYQTAILANLCRRVYTIEVVEELGLWGRDNLRRLGIDNVDYHLGDGRQGWPGYRGAYPAAKKDERGGTSSDHDIPPGPEVFRQSMQFDRILVAAATEEIPPSLLEQLRNKGKMVLPVGDYNGQNLLLWEKHEQEIKKHFLCYCRFVPLVHK